MSSVTDLITLALVVCGCALSHMASRSSVSTVYKQLGDFQLNRNLSYGQICSGVCHAREYILPVCNLHILVKEMIGK